MLYIIYMLKYTYIVSYIIYMKSNYWVSSRFLPLYLFKLYSPAMSILISTTHRYLLTCAVQGYALSCDRMANLYQRKPTVSRGLDTHLDLFCFLPGVDGQYYVQGHLFVPLSSMCLYDALGIQLGSFAFVWINFYAFLPFSIHLMIRLLLRMRCIYTANTHTTHSHAYVVPGCLCK